MVPAPVSMSPGMDCSSKVDASRSRVASRVISLRYTLDVALDKVANLGYTITIKSKGYK